MTTWADEYLTMLDDRITAAQLDMEATDAAAEIERFRLCERRLAAMTRWLDANQKE